MLLIWGYMFKECSLIQTIDVSSFDTSKVTNMNSMFCDCYALTNLNISN
ncbi:MAG: BspA family leucine-rich repeat surface protein [Lachnospiraceae bacterium]|nr:BspA family leucine-rich repeat surface protein [Lachnospiraceae bacterium]